MAARTEEAKSDRLTVRLPSRELERLRVLATSRGVDMASVGREAISAYLDGLDPHAQQERLAEALRATMREEADRVIERQEQITRSLIAALNTHLAANKR